MNNKAMKSETLRHCTDDPATVSKLIDRYEQACKKVKEAEHALETERKLYDGAHSSLWALLKAGAVVYRGRAWRVEVDGKIGSLPCRIVEEESYEAEIKS